MHLKRKPEHIRHVFTFNVGVTFLQRLNALLLLLLFFFLFLPRAKETD